jgi:hypothetical protein
MEDGPGQRRKWRTYLGRLAGELDLQREFASDLRNLSAKAHDLRTRLEDL